MKDQNNKFLLSIKALSLASLIAFLAGCEAEKVQDGEMPSVDVDAEGGELPSVTVTEGDLPDIDVDADPGALPEYDIDSKLEVGTRQETITVPEIRWDEDEVAETEVEQSETDVAAQTPPSATQPPAHQQELFVEQQDMEVLTQVEQQQSNTESVAQSGQLVDRLRNELDSDSPAMQDLANVQVEMQQDRLILQGQAQNEESKQDIVEAAENIADGREVVDNIQIGSSGTVGSTF